jgi:hypothetical protein
MTVNSVACPALKYIYLPNRGRMVTIERDEENIFVKGRLTGDIEELNVESGDLGEGFFRGAEGYLSLYL